ncbi:glycosyltransferase family 4 protein [Photobacterium sp.]|uniref:glycosyltransferase family 4 protein n=1 Tax=Photobacterium sp. TaxID=660 RepID=UPI00299D9904|nr:glycosyltransferase family 4 protein [Photobacterium sp.]MDX1303668.1 glycosyltransferase family 4 protein [Photobacterium sp.]
MSFQSNNKVGFILPGPRRESVGGYKIVYQYADYLSSEGFDVSVLYPTNNDVTLDRFNSGLGFLKKLILKYLNFHRWYGFSCKVNHMVSDDFDYDYLSTFDVLICTSIETYLYLSKKNKVYCKKIYFVQDFENWSFSDQDVYGTYTNKDFKIITISNYLKDKIKYVGGQVDLLLPNGIESDIFKLLNRPENRKETSFLFMYHPNIRKGCDILLDAIALIPDKENYSFECFSVYEKPTDFPDYIKYNHKPTRNNLNEIYNNNKFFICSSRVEGFGLTPAEAALSGCVILTTDNGGVNQYIVKDHSGFYFDDKTPESFLKLIGEVSEKRNLQQVSDNAISYIKSELVIDKCNAKLASYIRML